MNQNAFKIFGRQIDDHCGIYIGNKTLYLLKVWPLKQGARKDDIDVYVVSTRKVH